MSGALERLVKFLGLVEDGRVSTYTKDIGSNKYGDGLAVPRDRHFVSSGHAVDDVRELRPGLGNGDRAHA